MNVQILAHGFRHHATGVIFPNQKDYAIDQRGCVRRVTRDENGNAVGLKPRSRRDRHRYWAGIKRQLHTKLSSRGNKVHGDTLVRLKD